MNNKRAVALAILLLPFSGAALAQQAPAEAADGNAELKQEIEAQKQRLTSYQVQARFALASIYDRSADASGSEAAP